jgi:RNA polymerase sigma factor (sigma-70 family)
METPANAATDCAQYLGVRTGGAGVELSDSEVVVASLAGQPEEFATIVRRHGQAVHGYLARRVGHDLAGELLGEVWLRAFRSRHSFDREVESARPWLYGIARNTLRAEWRLRRIDGASGPEASDDPWPAVDARLDAVRQGPDLRAALDCLEEQDCEVLLLVAWEHLAPAEIAVALGMAQGTVRWRLHRARKQLQARFGDESPLRPFDTRTKEA